MRLLVDECIDERLRLLFPGHEVETARYANAVSTLLLFGLVLPHQ